MAEEVKTQNRTAFLDIMRVLATCAVVMLHTVTGVKDTTDMNLYPAEFRVFLAVLDLVTWSVPVFIMISGYLFLNPNRDFTCKQMLLKYCRRIVLALFLFGFPYACIELIISEHGFNLGMLGRSVIMVLRGGSWSHMWYLYLIFFLYLFTPMLKWMLQRINIMWLYALMAVMVFGSSFFLYINKYADAQVLPVLPDTCIYIFYYLCGFVLVKQSTQRKEGVQESKKNIPGWVLQGIIVIFFVGMICNRMLTDRQVQMAYDYPFTVIVAVLLFVRAANTKWKLSPEAAMRWRKLSDLCFAVYLIHPVFVNIAYKFLHLTPLDYPLWISLPMFWLAILLPAVVCAWLLRKIPLLRKYVL